jgi:N-acetylmuramoyl-L-alanine amidase CwlA
MMRPMQIVNDDRPSLNSMLAGTSKFASRYSTPATKPAHEHKKPVTKGSKPVAARSTTERTALVTD